MRAAAPRRLPDGPRHAAEAVDGADGEASRLKQEMQRSVELQFEIETMEQEARTQELERRKQEQQRQYG